MMKVLVVCLCLLAAATSSAMAQTGNAAKVGSVDNGEQAKAEPVKPALDNPVAEKVEGKRDQAEKAEPFSLLTLTEFKEQLTTYCRKDNTCKKNIRKIRTIKTCDQLQTFLDVNAVLIVDNDDQKGTVRDVVECDGGKDSPAVATMDAKR